MTFGVEDLMWMVWMGSALRWVWVETKPCQCAQVASPTAALCPGLWPPKRRLCPNGPSSPTGTAFGCTHA